MALNCQCELQWRTQRGLWSNHNVWTNLRVWSRLWWCTWNSEDLLVWPVSHWVGSTTWV